MRWAESQDMDYFVSAGREFSQLAGFGFDEYVYTSHIQDMIEADDMICMVTEPVTGHCFCRITPCLYDGQLLAHVFSTWGKGGLKCFDEVVRIARNMGAKYLIADMMHDKRIEAFYSRRGMTKADTNFLMRF